MTGDPLAEVLAAAQEQDAARIRLARAVRDARAAGHGWADLGRVLGMSRQAVFKRFGGPTDEPPGELAARPAASLAAAGELVVADLAAGRFADLAGRMSPVAAGVLTEDVLRSVWTGLVAHSGEPERVQAHGVERYDRDRTPVDPAGAVAGSVVVSVDVRCPRARWEARVALDGADRVTGVLLLPHGDVGPF